MTVLETIADEVKRITDEQIDQAALVFGPPEKGEETLCTIHSRYARALWALAHDYDRRGRLAAHACRFDAHTAEERDAFRGLAIKMAAFEEAARNLAWIEMRLEADGGVWLVCVGLRDGWTLVKTTTPQEDALEAIGALPVPPVLLKLLRRIRGLEDPDEDGDGKSERKPQ
jgi:hypothetical protein